MEDDGRNSNSCSFKLLQPELMTIEELCEILRACCVKTDLTSYSKNELVELFKRVALPLPQREYRGVSWREKLLLKNQKRKTSVELERNNVKKVCQTTASSHPGSFLKTSVTDPKNSCRLKPPVQMNNYTKKVLKLALPKSKSNESPLKEVPMKEEKTREKLTKSLSENSCEKQHLSNGKHKRIVIDFSESSASSTKTPKLVNLKRSTSNNEVPSSGQKVRKTINI